MSEDAGRLVGGRYRLGGVLGRGGMGTVWRGEDEVLGRAVAVKELRFPSSVEEDEKQRLITRTLREAKAIARIRSGSVVTVFDVVDEDDRPWIVMELVEGSSLADRIRQDGPLTPQRAAEVGLAVLDVLRAAHGEGVLHRDVKPSNVLLEDGTERVVLTDFGIAKVEGDPSVTSTGMLVGAPSYISPERARGKPPGPPADLWSLGALLFAAVEGRPPYDKGSAISTLTAVMTEPVPSPKKAGELSEVIFGLLEKDPEKRLDVDGAREQLQPVAAGTAGAGAVAASASAQDSGSTAVLPAGSGEDDGGDEAEGTADPRSGPAAGSGTASGAGSGSGSGKGRTKGKGMGKSAKSPSGNVSSAAAAAAAAGAAAVPAVAADGAREESTEPAAAAAATPAESPGTTGGRTPESGGPGGGAGAPAGLSALAARYSRRTLAAAGAAVVAVLALIAVLVVNTVGDEGGNRAKDAATSGAAGEGGGEKDAPAPEKDDKGSEDGKKDSPSPKAGESDGEGEGKEKSGDGAELPDGYTRVTDDRFHFSMAMPEDFKRTGIAGRNSGAKYSGGGLPKIQVDYSPSPLANAAAGWRKLEPVVRGSSSGYRLIGIEKVSWRGYPTVADWEFEREEDGKKVRVVNRGFKVDGSRGHAILITCEAGKWDEKECKTLRETAFETFKPLD